MNKRHPNWKGRSKTVTICKWHDTIYGKCIFPKASTPKLLELINEFRKVAGYKTDIQKSVAFLYTNNELSESKYIYIKITLKKIIPRNKLNQGGERLILWKYKTVMKETEDGTKIWKVILCSWIRIILLKWPYYLKKLTDSRQPLSKQPPMTFIRELQQTI